MLAAPTNVPPMVVFPPELLWAVMVGAATAPLPRTIPGPWSPNIALSRVVLPAPAVESTYTPLAASWAMVLPAPATVPPIVLSAEPFAM